jgi:hypothetical protein
MKTTEERLEMLRQQVISKIHWGARRGEVTDWLKEEHGIEGPRAEELLHAAACARNKAVREKAFLYLVLSLLGLVISGAFFFMQFVRHGAVRNEEGEPMGIQGIPEHMVPVLTAVGIVATVSLASLFRMCAC